MKITLQGREIIPVERKEEERVEERKETQPKASYIRIGTLSRADETRMI